MATTYVPVDAANGPLADMLRRAEQGDDVVLTRAGRPVVRLTAFAGSPTCADRARVLREVRAAAARTVRPALDVPRDFLHGPDGLPG